MAMKKRKQKESEEMQVKKKRVLEWRPEDCAQPIGDSTKSTGEGENKKCHYNKFLFHCRQYGLEDSVLLVPEREEQKSYVAIIKDIYKLDKERHVKLEVQWFYRPGDIEKKDLGNWESKDRRNIFYSFHRDEVFAESVKGKCRVHFLQQNKEIPDRRQLRGFIVQNIYDCVNKKLRKLSYKGFEVHQKDEINHRMAKTISRVGHLPDIVKEEKPLKRSVRKGNIIESNEVSNGRSALVNQSNSLADDSHCDKSLEELFEEIKHKFLTNEFLAANTPDYNKKFKILAEKQKNSRVLAKRLRDGELKPEQVIKMTCYELARGFTFDEMKADLNVPKMDDASPSSTSKSAGPKDSSKIQEDTKPQ